MLRLIVFAMFFCLAGCSQKPVDERVTIAATPSPIPEPLPPIYGAETDGPLPNVLSIGDSISGGYIRWVAQSLADRYDVHHPNDNCRNTVYTLEHLDEWFWSNDSIVIWNNGLWDSVSKEWHDQYVPEQPLKYYSVPLADYETNIIAIARRLKAKSARVIFVTTTEIPLTAGGGFEFYKEIAMNDIAKRVLPAEGIEIADLYTYEVPLGPDAHPNQWDVHYTIEASKYMAKFLVDAILKAAP